jgi:hypothetical protein
MELCEIWRFTALTHGLRDQLYMQSKVLIGVHIGEGIKVCQTAGRPIGKAWQRVKESLGTGCVKSVLVVYVCVCLGLIWQTKSGLPS